LMGVEKVESALVKGNPSKGALLKEPGRGSNTVKGEKIPRKQH